jgi:dTDP-4-amino-4,6-dideoxygalactose transaminase
VTTLLTSRSLILPLFHEMTEAEQDAVVEVVSAGLADQAPVPSLAQGV